ncbi:MAG: oligoendopeptidase F [Spirochaetaceae bacterium]|nr:oligoendopeptidase F [Spirochaetaceae bacterium]
MKRSEVHLKDTWDLTKIFATDKAFYAALEKFKNEEIVEAEKWKGLLAKNKENLLKGFEWMKNSNLKLESLFGYAQLKSSEDSSNVENQKMISQISSIYAIYLSQLAYWDTEILSIENQLLEKYISDPDFTDISVTLSRLKRQKEHILSEKEEKILAAQMEVGGKASKIFSDLTNVDFKFGEINGKPLTQSTFGIFLKDKDENIRKQAYDQLYKIYADHKFTLSNVYETSIRQDIFSSTVRGYKSTRGRKLFSDNVDEEVYDNLIKEVHKGLPILHRYYKLRARLMGKDKIHHYDVYTSLVDGYEAHHSYEEAIDLISNAIKPLGEGYRTTLINGLTTERWVDKYENDGKKSGAFSSGTYTSNPYILLNYNEESLRDIFTLIHEGGHSMHSHYSNLNNNYFNADYTIFEAEVASTFNEQLLAAYLLKKSKDDKEKAYILGKQIDDVLATLFRQTMFAEYEHTMHVLAEEGKPITLDIMRGEYKKLLELYFGDDVILEENSDLEGLRIPHFYSSYYVYKYATGISAAIALSRKVLNGNEDDLKEYMSFLKSGGSKFPIDTLKMAGVDMRSPQPIDNAIKHFENMLNEFESIVG